MAFFRRRILITIIAAVCTWNAPALAGNGVTMDGGGALEQVLLYSWTNLGDLVRPCLANPDCYHSEKGRAVAQLLVNAQSDELKRGALKFEENESSTAFFTTGATVGSPIVFNLVPLYQQHPALTLAEATDLLLQALLNHHPDADAGEFAQTRQGLLEFWNSKVEIQDLRSFRHADISLLAIQRKPFTVLAAGGSGYADVRSVLEAALKCMGPGKSRLENLRGFYWLDPVFLPRSVELSVYGRIDYTCLNGSAERAWTGDFKLTFNAKVTKGDTKAGRLEDLELNVDNAHPRLTLFNLH